MAITHNENQFVRVIAVKSPPAGGDVDVEGVRLYLTGVFTWECAVALYEKHEGDEVEEHRFLTFLDANGNPTKDRYDSTWALVLPWLFPFAGRALTLWRGKHHAKVRFNLYRQGGAKFTANRSAPIR